MISHVIRRRIFTLTSYSADFETCNYNLHDRGTQLLQTGEYSYWSNLMTNMYM